MRINIIKLIPAFVLLMLANACSKDGSQPAPGKGQELILAPSMGHGRAAVNYSADRYFGLAGYGEADVTVGVQTVAYTYNSSFNELSATGSNEPFRFPTDGSPLRFRVQWPTAEKREAFSTLPKDQSTPEAFFASDFLSVDMKAYQSAKVMINFEHEHCKASFTLEGTSFYGKKIEKLVFNGYTAYCDADMGIKDAQLIFKPLSGQYIFTPSSSGALKISGDEAMYNFTLEGYVTGFEPGSHHTLKLNVNH